MKRPMTDFSPIEQAALRHAAAFATDLHGRLAFANDHYCAMRGDTAERLLGRILPWVARLAARIETAGNAPLWHGELPPECGEGLTGTIVPRRDATGAPCGFLCFVSPQPIEPSAPAVARDPNLVGIFLTSPAGEPLFISDQIHARYAQLPAALCGLEASICALEHWQQAPDSGWRRWLRGHAPAFTAELELTTRAGATERLQQRATRLLAGDQCLGIVGTLSLVEPGAGRLHRQWGVDLEPSLKALLDRLLGHATHFAQDLLRVGRLHDLGEVENFLQGLAAVALASQSVRLQEARDARETFAPHQRRGQIA